MNWAELVRTIQAAIAAGDISDCEPALVALNGGVYARCDYDSNANAIVPEGHEAAHEGLEDDERAALLADLEHDDPPPGVGI